jgi:hypothetical protein
MSALNTTWVADLTFFQAMSFAVVTLVYILVFLCGEGLTSDEIRNDPTRNFEQVRRNWLRVWIPRLRLSMN